MQSRGSNGSILKEILANELYAYVEPDIVYFVVWGERGCEASPYPDKNQKII